MKRVALSSTGTWPAGEHLPMGSFSDATDGRTITWQIETAGSWNWELSTIDSLPPYLLISGPSFQESGFTKLLQPGETFVSVPCALVWGDSFTHSIQELTKYRRHIRRPAMDNNTTGVIFNDYMNLPLGRPDRG